jgi:protocatechuate 3,4-dioxygenase beta subunit
VFRSGFVELRGVAASKHPSIQARRNFVGYRSGDEIVHSDDLPLGRLLTRREALALIGVSGAALVSGALPAAHAATAAPLGCIVRPAQTEGPFFVDGELERSDIRFDAHGRDARPGTPLKLRFNVARMTGASCTPLAGAQVHVWHSDALGVYSDSGVRRAAATSSQFLRGYQLTDTAGAAQFLTIFPGWYAGRTAHIHFKIRIPAASGSSAHAQEFTSQLYFDDALSDQVFAAAPYRDRGKRELHNADDFLFRGGGERLLLELQADGSGYVGRFDVGVQV